MTRHTESTDQHDDDQHQDPGQQRTDQHDDGQDRPSPSRTAAEWVVFAVAAMLVAAVVAVIGSDALGARRPPEFTTEVGAVRERDGEHYITVGVTNEGDATAAKVMVGAALRQDGEVLEQATQTIDFLAGHERRQVRFVFEHDPRSLELRTGVTAFQVP